MPQELGRRILLVMIWVVIAACFVIPFTLLRNVDAWYGSFLFWSFASLVVIAFNWILSSRWED